MPVCSWPKGVHLWCLAVRDTSALSDTKVCSYDARLSLIHRCALMMPGCHWRKDMLLWHKRSSWHKRWSETKVSCYGAWLSLTHRYPFIMPGCSWQKSVVLWCLAVVDTKVYSYDAWLPLTQSCALMMPVCPWRSKFALLMLCCPWDNDLLSWFLAVLDTKVYNNNNTLPVQIKICCGDGAAIPKVWSYDTRLFFDKTICCCDAWLSLTHKLALMMPDHSWKKGLLLWSPAALDTNASSKVCSDDAWLSLTQGFELMMPGCTWHNCVPLYSIG